MTNIKTSMTAQTPSGFGMPACGHASSVTTGLIAATGAFGSVLRDRQGVVTGLPVYAATSIWGTAAWRPPTS
ncbi:MAG: hypothetical protein LH468_01410 [Nocardioides sp.]|nr:hypothetical protein [Nocardioides sp.]